MTTTTEQATEQQAQYEARKAAYEEKRQRRLERLRAAAERSAREGSSLLNSARSSASAIPFGQPILIGHHSEKRDRNYRERIHRKFRRGFELQERALELASRAESVENNTAIYSDNPDAVDSLRIKLAYLEADQILWKSVNKLVKKNDREGLKALGISDTLINEYFTPDFAGRIGIPSYQLTNNNANIRRIKERIEEVSRKQALKDYEEKVGDITIEYAPGENRIRLFYPSRVDLDTFKLLKQHGFRSLRSAGEGAFSGYHNNNCLYFINKYIKQG